MALFPFYRYRFFDDFFDPFFFNRLDFFDPWFDFNMFPPLPPMMPRSDRFKYQERITNTSTRNTNRSKSVGRLSRVPSTDNFRIQSNINEFNPDTVGTRNEDRQSMADRKRERLSEYYYKYQESRETRNTPRSADSNRLSSYVAPNNTSVTEVPIQNERRFQQTQNDNRSLTRFDQFRDSSFDDSKFPTDAELQPRITDRGNNQKQMEISVEMKDYRPEDIQVSVKNNELVVKGERQYNDANRSERSSFFHSTTLPPGTQVDRLQSRFDNGGQLKIEAPLY